MRLSEKCPNDNNNNNNSANPLTSRDIDGGKKPTTDYKNAQWTNKAIDSSRRTILEDIYWVNIATNMLQKQSLETITDNY